jgi:hypothetical protein
MELRHLMITYEERLNRDLNWALREGSMHFEEKNAVHDALHKITKKLDELNVPYAVVGAMAMFFHGYRRFTDDIDILLTREGLKLVHDRLEGLGYLPPFANSRHLRDTELGVKIEFLVAGDYPGDGKPKSIAFPNPVDASIQIEGMSFLRLPDLVNLKLASGMTNPGRLKDLGDVQEMIDVLNLPAKLETQLAPFVQTKYAELWKAVRNKPREP